MRVDQPARIHVVAVIAATTAALIGRSWLQVEIVADGVQKGYAADLSYLVVPIILLILLCPVLYEDKVYLRHQLRRKDLSLQIILSAAGIGLLIRILWWGQLVAGISFGLYVNDDPSAIEGPIFRFHCSPPHVVALGFLVMAVMVPIVEEFTHRAYVQSALHRQGAIIAILVSASIFAVFHPPTSWVFSFFAAIVFGVQYWNSGSLWPSLITHATFNFLVQVDWRCMNTQWNPRATDLPLWVPGVLSALVVLSSMTGIIWLIKNTGAAGRPDAERVTERLRPAR
jgi:membrane protease YdiL (CAAX protease family)